VQKNEMSLLGDSEVRW